MTESSTHPWTRILPPLPDRPAVKPRREWLAPTGLILLSLVPIAAGASRLTQLTTGAVSADNTRFFDSPVPVVVHIVSVTVFSLLGALQFAPSLRRHRWHRRAGRIVAPAGLLTAERTRRGTRAETRALSCHDQAVLALRWFLDGTCMSQLARDDAIGKSTAYDYLHEGIDALGARSPSLHRALLAAKAAGYGHARTMSPDCGSTSSSFSNSTSPTREPPGKRTSTNSG